MTILAAVSTPGFQLVAADTWVRVLRANGTEDSVERVKIRGHGTLPLLAGFAGIGQETPPGMPAAIRPGAADDLLEGVLESFEAVPRHDEVIAALAKTFLPVVRSRGSRQGIPPDARFLLACPWSGGGPQALCVNVTPAGVDATGHGPYCVLPPDDILDELAVTNEWPQFVDAVSTQDERTTVEAVRTLFQKAFELDAQRPRPRWIGGDVSIIVRRSEP